jgi:hypothetical protein
MLEMNIPIGDVDVRVGNPLENERPSREGREATKRCPEES